MLVVSYLAQLLLPRLADAVRDVGAEHVNASSWDEVENIIRHRPVDVLVLDPYADRVGRAREVARLLRRFPSTPVIAYTQFIPPALRALTLLAQHGLHETVLFQIDDGRTRLARLLVRASTHKLSTRVLDELREERGRLAPNLADAIDDLFRRPFAYASGHDLVLASQVPLTTMYRALLHAGLAPPKQLFVAARVLHAVGYLRDPGYTVQAVAEKTGYRHPRVLTQHTLAVFGARPSALRSVEDSETLSKLLKYARCTGPDERAPAALPSCSTGEGAGEEVVRTDGGELRPAAIGEGLAGPPADITWSALVSAILEEPDLDSELRGALLTAIRKVSESEGAELSAAAGTLLAYGKRLVSGGRVALAARIYRVIIAEIGPLEERDPSTAATVFMQYGYAARFLGDFDASDNAYRRATAIADEAGAKAISLRAGIGMTNTLKARGNLGEAEALIDHVLARAVASGLFDVEALALHTRGMIRTGRGQYADAMIDLFRAYKLMDDASDKEFLLGDLAGTAWEAGYRQVGYDAYRILAYKAREPLVRSMALINLLEHAAYGGVASDFDRLQADLAAHARQYPLPVDQAVHLALYKAYGVERFGTHDAAVEAYRTVITQARDVGSHQVEFKAEERLTALLSGNATWGGPPTREPPDILRSVVETLAEWSALVTV